MKKIKIPEEFIEWFWMMYSKLGIMIVINKCKSEIMKVNGGFLEGQPPSMAAFVVSMITLMKAIEEILTGIKFKDRSIHKMKMFSDDMKLFIAEIREINTS